MSLWATRTTRQASPDEKARIEQDIGEDGKRRIEMTRELCREIYVAIPSRGSLNVRHLERSIIWANAGIAISPTIGFDGQLDLKRAVMCRRFLNETGRKFMVMIDDDVIPMDPESIVRLCGHDLPVVSGVACAFNPEIGTFACIGVLDKTGIARWPTTIGTKTMPAYGVREVKNAGAGILAIRRDVIETVMRTYPPFMLPESVRLEAAETCDLKMTEDVWFSKQVHDAGFKMYVDFSVQCFHDKTLPLHWPESGLDETLDAADWNVTAAGARVG